LKKINLLFRDKKAIYGYYTIGSFISLYLVQFLFAKYFTEDSFGLLKKILLTVNYLGIISFGYKDEFYHELCEKRGEQYNELWNKYFPSFLILNILCTPLYFFVGIYFLELQIQLLFGIYLYVLSAISLTFVESFYYGRDKQEVYAKKKFIRDLLISLSILTLIIIGSSDSEIILGYFYLFSIVNLTILFQSDIEWSSAKKWQLNFFPAKGIKIQLGNFISQVSLTIDRLLGVIFLTLSGFALYSFNFLPIQAVLLLAGMIGSYSYRYHFDGKIKRIHLKLILGSFLTILVLIPFFKILHIFFPNYALDNLNILFLSIGTILNAYYQSYIVNQLRMIVKNYVTITITIISISTVILYLIGDTVDGLIKVYLIASIMRILITKIYLWKR